jgi:glutathione S-transferase
VTFALEEKNLPYDSVLIELRSKPHWYKDKVPTELTPAAIVNGELVYESLDILKVMSSPSPHDYRACCRHTAFPTYACMYTCEYVSCTCFDA